MKDINTEIKKLLAERDMALNSLAGVQCHPRLIDALRDRVYQFYDQPIKRLEACFQVAEYWAGQTAPNTACSRTCPAASSEVVIDPQASTDVARG